MRDKEARRSAEEKRRGEERRGEENKDSTIQPGAGRTKGSNRPGGSRSDRGIQGKPKGRAIDRVRMLSGQDLKGSVW
jgi:hypothetical protein